MLESGAIAPESAMSRPNAPARRATMRKLRPCLFACLCLGLVCAAAPAAAQWLSRDAEAMGTTVRIALWHTDAAAGERLVDAALAELRRVGREFHPWDEGSQLARLNADAARGWQPVSAELLALLQRAHHYSELSDGAFDITFASVGRLHDYRSGVAPDEGERERARDLIDYRQIEIDADHRRVRYTREGVVADLGGIAKGHAVARAAALLRKAGVTHAEVTAGGDTHFLGDHRGRPWSVGVQHPRRRGESLALLPLIDEAISTSGDYERYFVADGVRYHHIIDPAQGRSAADLRSASVIGPDALSTDALSTSVFVLGAADGLALIETLPGYDALLVDGAGRLHYSSGLARR